MRRYIEHYHYNVAAGPHYEPTAALPAAPPVDYPVRFIAYYLPQFHRIHQNDTWWGPGFTEWTNVTKALPRYVGHYQPRLPADLGFYDASQKETLLRQAELARRGGVYGFCIHDYWFSGEKLLSAPLEILLANPDIDLRFCLNWANESWSRRWDGTEQDLLMEQRYLPDDAERYVESIAPAVRDRRYIRIEGRPLLMIYRPSIIPGAKQVFARWRRHFMALGLGEPYLVMPQAFSHNDPRPFGLDAVAGFPPHGAWDIANDRNHLKLHDPLFAGGARCYDAMASLFELQHPTEYRLFPGCCPMWDNEARKPRRGEGFYGSTPERYGEWLDRAARYAMSAEATDERIVFINAWNEWAEGAYLEPDRHHGIAYLAETRRVLDGLNHPRKAPQTEERATKFRARRSFVNFAVNLARHFKCQLIG